MPAHEPSIATSTDARSSGFVIEHGLPLVLFIVVALALTWPPVLHIGSAFPSEPGEGAQDLWEKLWNIWWFATALRQGSNPFFTNAIFYPQGASLLFHPLNPTTTLMALPVQAVAGPTVAYNVVVLLSFVLSGYGVYLLGRRHGSSRTGSMIGGLAYTASAFHLFHMRLSHLELVPTQWLPLYALALDALLERPTVWRVLATTAALLLLAFTSLYLTLYAAVLTALWIVWALIQRRDEGRRLLRPALGFGSAMVLALVIIGPVLLLPMAVEARSASYMVQSIETSFQRAARPLDSFLPLPSHPIRTLLTLPVPRSSGAFLGYVAVVLAVVGAVARPKIMARWMVLALIGWLLSLGPALPFYRALYSLPLFQVSRYPDRFAILTLLSVAVLATVGADALVRRLRGQGRGIGGAALFGLMLFELHPGTLALTEPFDNPFYHTLAADPGQFSVLEMPINRVNSAWLDMYAQTIHHHPIPNGTLARAVPRIPYEWLPLFQQFERPADTDDIAVQTPDERAAALRYFNLRYLLYHRRDGAGPITPPTAEDIGRISGVPVSVVYEDEELVAYRFDTPPGPANISPIVRLGTGWHNLEAPGPDVHRWLRDGRGTFDVYMPTTGSAALRLELAAYQRQQRLDIFLDGQQVGQVEVQTWPTEVVTPPFPVQAGTHTLELVAPDEGISPQAAGDGADDRVLSVGVWAIKMEAR